MSAQFFLEEIQTGGRINRIPLNEFPQLLGRAKDCSIVLDSPRVSRHHARLELVGQQVQISDLGSTNGTLLNRQALTQPALLKHGDVLQLAEYELRFFQAQAAAPDSDGTVIGKIAPSQQFQLHAQEFQQLLQQRAVTGFIQPIVDQQQRLHAYELLGRGRHPQLPMAPGVLFGLAESLNQAVAFSELLREVGIAEVARAKIKVPIFFNIHPNEMDQPKRLLRGLERLRSEYPQLRLVLEVHEAAVSNVGQIAALKQSLRTLDIGLAYDDFGAGQARLLELIEAPGDYLKFDHALISKLTPNSAHYKLLESLTRLVRDMGCATLAECVETEQQAECCRQMGIEFYQGYLFGRPQAVAT